MLFYESLTKRWRKVGWNVPSGEAERVAANPFRPSVFSKVGREKTEVRTVFPLPWWRNGRGRQKKSRKPAPWGALPALLKAKIRNLCAKSKFALRNINRPGPGPHSLSGREEGGADRSVLPFFRPANGGRTGGKVYLCLSAS